MRISRDCSKCYHSAWRTPHGQLLWLKRAQNPISRSAPKGPFCLGHPYSFPQFLLRSFFYTVSFTQFLSLSDQAMHLLNCDSGLLRAVVLGMLAALGCFGLTSSAQAEKLLEWSSESSAPPTFSADPALAAARFDKPLAAQTAQSPSTSPQSTGPQSTGLQSTGPPPADPQQADPPQADPRHLTPQSPALLGAPAPAHAPRRPTSISLPQIESLATAGTGVAIVVGLLLICMWLVRRGGPKPTSPLPTDAVAVLGRVPLANQGFAQLLQIGNKLVLVGMTAEGMTPLTEVTDPAEVERLLGICHRNHKQSTTAEFQQVLQKLSQEPAHGFLENEASTAYARASR